MQIERTKTRKHLFQTIDFKEACKSKFYSSEEIVDEVPQENQYVTWKYSRHIKDPEKHDYAFIWSGGNDLAKLCPQELRAEFDRLQERFLAFHISFREAKLNEEELCFFDTLPIKFLKDWCEIKNEICKKVLDKEEPQDYQFQKQLSFLLEKIKNKPLNIDWAQLDKTSKKTGALLKIRNENKNKIIYNQYGTVTGRLSTSSNSFPILTIDKANRSVMKPKNDLFLELDYNAAELRTLLALTNKEQPDIDLHSWINTEIYKDKYDRQEVKQKVFAWLYNSSAKNKKLNNLFQRDELVEKYYDGEKIRTYFGREIEVNKRKAVNYLIQSTTSDIVLRQALKIDNLLSETKSFISFIMHDSIVIDIDRAQREKIAELVSIFSKTDLGDYKVNISLGKDYGRMKRVE